MERPKTGMSASSVAYSAIGSMSSASQSATGSQLNALVARRSQLRAQLSAVEHQLATMPPSTAGSVATRSYAHAAPPAKFATGPLPAPITIYRNPPKDAADGNAVLRAAAEQKRAAAIAASSGGTDDSLPGAMRPGRYAFWPKRLPGASAHRSSMSRGGGAAPQHRTTGVVVSGGVGAMPAKGLAASAISLPPR